MKYLSFLGLFAIQLSEIVGMATTLQHIYAYANETVTLVCPLASQNHIWRGPETIRTVYVTGNKVNTNLEKYSRLKYYVNNKTMESSLRIKQFSFEDQGQYTCYADDYAKSPYTISVKLRRDPSNITIADANGNYMFVVSNITVKLTCTVISGVPEESMYWITNGITIAKGGPSLLVHSFTPGPEDHLKKFTCKAETNLNSSLEKTFQLCLYSIPVVRIEPPNIINIVEGEPLVINCSYISNHECTTVVWKWMTGDTIDYVGTDPVLKINTSRENAGMYICQVTNPAGSSKDNVNITVLYAPDVRITFNDSERMMKCNANGNPPRYTFYNWEHTSVFKEHIRYINDNGNGSIVLTPNDDEVKRHGDRGIYVCQVSNGVLKNNQLIQSAKYELKASGRPYFVTENNITQFGRLNQKAVIRLNVVSIPKLTYIQVVFNSSEMIVDHEESPSKIRDTVYGQNILVNGYILLITIFIQTEKDFHNYTIVVSNHIGSNRLNVDVKPASTPQIPADLQIFPNGNEVKVTWMPRFDGGYSQTFYIEHQRIGNNFWNWTKANQLNASCIGGLEYDTRYRIRMYAENIIGKSNFTDEIEFTTGVPQTHDYIPQIMIAVVIAIILAATGIMMYYVFTKGRNICSCLSMSWLRWNSFRHAGVGAIQNDGYEMQNQLASPNEPRETPVYSSIDRRANLSIGQAVSYSIAKKGKPNPVAKHKAITEKDLNKVAIACKPKNSIASDGTDESKKNDAELNYIEVCFDQKPKDYQFKIHGIDKKSEYVDIDFSKSKCVKQDSDRDYESDDDFASVLDVCAMKKDET